MSINRPRIGWKTVAKQGYRGVPIPAWVVNPNNPPSTFLDFTQNRAWKKSGSLLVPATSLLTVARSSTGYVNDASGNWTSVGNNVLRWSNLGTLIEEARTNSIRNNSMQGAAAGSPGTIPANWGGNLFTAGLTQTVALATVNGIDFIQYAINGTASSGTTTVQAFDATAQIPATPGQVWTGSLFVQLLSGSLTTNITAFDITIREYDSGSAFLRQTLATIQGAGAAVQRISVSATMGASTAFVQLGLRPTYLAAAINYNVGFGWPQLELGASATSPIRTTNAAATRAADVVTLTSPGVFGSAYTLYAKATPQAPNPYTLPQYVMMISNGTTNNRSAVFRASNAASNFLNTGNGANNLSAAGASWAQNTSGKIALAYAPGDQAGIFNNGTIQTASGVNVVSPPTQVEFGCRLGVQQLNGFLAEGGIWLSQRVPNSQLQSMLA